MVNDFITSDPLKFSSIYFMQSYTHFPSSFSHYGLFEIKLVSQLSEKKHRLCVHILSLQMWILMVLKSVDISWCNLSFPLCLGPRLVNKTWDQSAELNTDQDKLTYPYQGWKKTWGYTVHAFADDSWWRQKRKYKIQKIQEVDSAIDILSWESKTLMGLTVNSRL